MKRLALCGIVFVLLVSGCTSLRNSTSGSDEPYVVKEAQCCQTCVSGAGQYGGTTCLEIFSDNNVTGECVKLFTEVANLTVDDCRDVLDQSQAGVINGSRIQTDAVQTDDSVLNQPLLGDEGT